MKYLTFIRHSESYRESPPPPALMEAMGKFVEKSLKKGTLVLVCPIPLPSLEGGPPVARPTRPPDPGPEALPPPRP